MCPVPPNASRLHRRAGSGGHRYQAVLRSGGTASGMHHTGPARTRTLCPVPTAMPAADPERPGRPNWPYCMPAASASSAAPASAGYMRQAPARSSGFVRSAESTLSKWPVSHADSTRQMHSSSTRLFSWIVYNTSTLRILFTHCSPFFFGIFVLRHVPSLNRHRKPCRASLQLSHCGSLSTRGISGPMTRPSGRTQQLVGRVLDRPFPYGYFRIFITSRLTQKSGERLALLPIAPRFCFAYFVIVCALFPPDLFMQTAPRKYFRGAVTSAFVQTAYQIFLPVTIRK